MKISEKFKVIFDEETGRKLVQLTQGNGFCYPLYYFIPSITRDNRYIIYHKAQDNEVQLYKLDLHTACSTQLTNAVCPNTHWRQWCIDPGKGVLDHRSVLNTEKNEVIYFDGPLGNDVRCVNIETLEDRRLFTLDEDRAAIGQNCVTPDGKWFVYIHADRKKYDSIFREGTNNQVWSLRSSVKGTALCAYHLETGEHRTLLRINSPIHHVIAYDNHHVVFCHLADENSMLLTRLEGGWYTHMRTQDDDGGCVCHYVNTKKGIAYEVLRDNGSGAIAGIYNPFSNKKYEFRLPEFFGYTHTGCDEEGRLFFYENMTTWMNEPDCIHDMFFLKKHDREQGDQWVKLIGNRRTYRLGQKAHFHPRLVGDRNWILFTGGDAVSQTNQLFLMDISDLSDTEGIPDLL